MDEGGRFWRFCRRALVAALAVAALAVALVPLAVTRINYPTLVFDLSDRLSPSVAKLVTNHTVRVDFRVRGNPGGGYAVLASGTLLDWPFSADIKVRLGWISAEGGGEVSLDGTNWRADVDFRAKSASNWEFGAKIGETAFTLDDPVVGKMLSRLLPDPDGASLSGALSLSAGGGKTPDAPVLAWSANASLKDIALGMPLGGGRLTVERLRTRVSASGIAGRTEIAPLYPRADSVEAAGIVLSNVFANIRATERSYLVTEAGADCCGGDLRLYSLFLDPERLNAGATVFAERIDAGAVLARVSGFRGEASGRLHGKLPFRLKDGRRLRLGEAYLFSPPGEGGKLRIDDARPMVEHLAMAGLDEASRKNLAEALADLDYSVLRVEYSPGEDDEGALSVRLEGSATRKGRTVPVNIRVTTRGDLERLLNAGIGLSRR
ncbi:MAG: YdbH domain-containing protein [Kiritimatiellae bacterium]|nr:YdbH domain-containing protein [Kiritimatiellia bacterium]